MADTLTTNDLVALLRVHPLTISRWLKSRPDFPRPTAAGRKRLWDRAEVEAWMRSRVK